MACASESTDFEFVGVQGSVAYIRTKNGSTRDLEFHAKGQVILYFDLDDVGSKLEFLSGGTTALEVPASGPIKSNVDIRVDDGKVLSKKTLHIAPSNDLSEVHLTATGNIGVNCNNNGHGGAGSAIVFEGEDTSGTTDYITVTDDNWKFEGASFVVEDVVDVSAGRMVVKKYTSSAPGPSDGMVGAIAVYSSAGTRLLYCKVDSSTWKSATLNAVPS